MALGVPAYAEAKAALLADYIGNVIDLAGYTAGLAVVEAQFNSVPGLADKIESLIAIKAVIMDAYQAGIGLRGTVASISELPAEADEGAAYKLVNILDPDHDGHLFARIDGVWEDLGLLTGETGRSAYQVAVANGFIGTEADYAAAPLDAATLAESKAGLADEKATLADEKAGIAQAAADNADDKAAAAQTVVDAGAAILAAKDVAVDAKVDAEVAAASIGFLYDVNSVRYWYGKPVVSASADPENKGSWVVTDDGFTYAKWAIRSQIGNGLSFTKNVADGFYELSLGTVEGILPLGSGGASIDTRYTRYFAGSRVVWGAGGDGNDRVPLFLNEAGFTFGKFNFIAGAGISITFDGASMSTTFEVEPPDNPDVLLVGNNGATIDPTSTFYFAGKKVIWGAAADPSGRVPMFVTEDGILYGKPNIVAGPGIEVAFDGETMSLTVTAAAGGMADNPLETADYLFTTEDVAGDFQIIRRSKALGLATQVTDEGNNFNPRLSADGTKIFYSTDRNGGREIYYQDLDGGNEYPALGLPSITPLGDSMTAAGMADLVAAHFGLPLSTPSSGPGGGIGSQKANQIAGRYDAIPLTCSVTGDSIGSGPNTLTAISIPIMSRSGDAVGAVRTLKAQIGSITGALTSTQYATAVAGAITYDSTNHYIYSFTPDAGQTLPAATPAGSALHIDLEDRDRDFILIWPGRNNVGIAGWQIEVRAQIDAIMARQRNPVFRGVVIGITNAVYEPSGHASYNEIVAFNASLAADFGGVFWDPRPTFNAGTATDIPAPSLRADDIHYNNTGKTALANALIAHIETEGLL